MRKKLTYEEILQRELKELENLPRISPKELELVDILAGAMLDRFLQDQVLGINRKREKNKV